MTADAYLVERLGATPPGAMRITSYVAGYSRGRHQECRAKARTLARRMDVCERTVRRWWRQARRAGLTRKTERRCRYSVRVVTPTGRELLAHMSGVQPASRPRGTECDPHAYRPPARRPGHGRADRAGRPVGAPAPLSPRAWEAMADWLATDVAPTSWARCAMMQRMASGLAHALARSREWPRYRSRLVQAHGAPPPEAEDIVRLAMRDAIRAGARPGTVESAYAYLGQILAECVDAGRLPGPRPPHGSVEARGPPRAI